MINTHFCIKLKFDKKINEDERNAEIERLKNN